MRVAADVGVDVGDAFLRVDDEQRDVGGFEVLARHDDGELLGHHLGLALAPDAGGIDEAEEVALALDDLVDRIARGAGDRRDDGAAGAGQRVQQRGLADVRAADDGDLGLARLVLAVGALLADGLRAAFFAFGSSSSGFELFVESIGFFFGRRLFVFVSVVCVRSGRTAKTVVQQVADAGAVLGRDRHDVP